VTLPLSFATSVWTALIGAVAAAALAELCPAARTKAPMVKAKAMTKSFFIRMSP
jgi:hypothetical protein